MKRGPNDKPLARILSIVVSISMVLSLVPSDGVAEARAQLMAASLEGEAAAVSPAPAEEEAAQPSSDEPATEQEAQAPPADDQSGEAATEGEGGDEQSGEQTSTEGEGENTQPEQTDQPAEGEKADDKQEQEAQPEEQPAQPEASANLREFITGATIEGAGDQDGAKLVSEANTYSVKLTFAERTDKRFADEGELLLELPGSFHPAADQPDRSNAIAVRYTDANGAEQSLQIAPNAWWVDGNTLHFTWATENDAAREALLAATDARFELAVAGTFAKDATEVDFGAGAIGLVVTPIEQPAEEKLGEQKPEEKPAEEQKPAEEEKKEEKQDEKEADKPAKDESPKTEEKPASKRTTYIYDDGAVRVTANVANAEDVPDDAELKVSRVGNTGAYLDALNAASSTEYDDSNTLLYDVKFVKDSKEIEPAGSVDVHFEFLHNQLADELDAPRLAPIEVHHIPEVDGEPVVQNVNASVTVQNESASFTTPSFSVFSFSFTVDFERDGYFYSMQGLDSISLSSLFLALGINESVGNVDTVEFSNPELLAVTTDEINNDWTLTSLQPFTTPETLTVSMLTGGKYVIQVTDDQVLANQAPVGQTKEPEASEQEAGIGTLAELLTGASINAPTNEQGQYMVTPGTNYNITLAFAEQPEGKQFPLPGTEMTYQIPSEIVSPQIIGNGTFTINVTDTSTGQVFPVKGNTYALNGNTLKVTFNPDDPNVEKLKASANVRFNVTFQGSIDENATNIPFSSTVNKTVVVDNSSNVTVNKSGYFNLNLNKVFYTVTVQSSGNSTNVHVHDTINDTAGVVTGISNLHYSSSMRGQDFTEGVTGGVNGKTYDYTFANMSRNESITFTYEGDIDPSKISVDPSTGKVTYTAQNEVEVESDQDNDTPPTSKEVIVDYTPKLNKDGVVSQNGKTITYTVTYNEDGIASMKGNTLTDRIRESSRQYLKFPAQNVKVDMYTVNRDAAGNKTGETKVEPSREFSIQEGSEFSYQVPNDDPAYKYVITVVGEVQNTSGLEDAITVYNDVEVPGNNVSDGETVQPAGGIVTVDKVVNGVDYQNKEISWTSTFTVPTTGLTEATATDTYPIAEFDNKKMIEPIKHSNVTDFNASNNWSDGQVTITGLTGAEHVVVDWQGVNEKDWQGNIIAVKGATFKFYKSAGETEEGINGGNDIRTITLTYKTEINDDWYENWTKAPGHTNTFSFHNKQKQATAYVVQDGVKKTGQVWGYRTVNGVQLPIYEYTLELNNVTQDVNVITDTFNTSILEPFNPDNPSAPYTKTAGDEKSWWAWRTTNQTYNPRLGVQVDYVTTTTGMTITTTAASMVHDPNSPTGFYPVTKLIYYLTVKDQAALNQLGGDAAQQEDHKAKIHNEVEWKDKTGGCNVEYEYPGLTKELLTPDNELVKTDKDIWGDFRITYNPGGARLHDGALKDMTDTIENLSVDITSINIEPAGTGITYDMEGNVLTFKNVPDSTPIVITYRARVIFADIGQSGETKTVNFKNTAEIEGYEDDVNKTAQRTNSGAGSGDIYSVNLMKYQAGDMGNKLNGAKFQLYHGKSSASSSIGYVIDESNPVRDKDGNIVTFTTGGQRKYGLTQEEVNSGETINENPGMITIKGDQTRDGWAVNADTYYFLKEIEAPSGYMLANFDYAFNVSGDGTTNYSKYIYHAGDNMSAKNYKGNDLNVLKSWSDGNAAHESDTVVVRLQQRSSTDSGATWSAWSNTIRRQENGNWVDVDGDVEGKTILTLTKNNNWQGKFASLPTTVPVSLEDPDGADMQVEYQIREWAINGVAADQSLESVRIHGSNSDYEWTYSGSGNGRQISNKPIKGSLKLKKLVTVTGSTDGDLADGDYTFEIRKQGNNMPLLHTVVVTVQSGEASSATIDGEDVQLSDGYVEVPDLTPGTYTIRETNSTNERSTLKDITTYEGNAKWFAGGQGDVVVEAGKTASEVPDKGKIDFTNGVEVGSLKIKKNVTINGVPAKDTAAFGTQDEADTPAGKEYTFQIWKGNYKTENGGTQYGRVKITFEHGVATSAQYEIIAERTQDETGNNVLHWHNAQLNDDGSVQINDLETGVYTIHELEGIKQSGQGAGQSYLPDGVYLVGGNQQGGNNLQVSVEANNTTNIPTVSFTNDKEVTGNLKLSKSLITSATGDNKPTFNFVVTLYTDANRQTVATNINGNYGAMTFNNGRANVSITGDGSVQATGIPTGLYYTITEAAANGFSITGITTNGTDQKNDGKATGLIAKTDSEVEFENTRDEGSLKVTKTIASDFPNDLTKQFTFTVTLDTPSLTQTFATIESGDKSIPFANSTATFTLTHGQTASANGIPAGVRYTVTETVENGFSTTWTGNTSDTIPKGGTAEVGATNTRNTGNLEIDKTVVSSTESDKDPNQTKFNFTVTLSDTSINGEFPIMDRVGHQSDKKLNFSNGVATIQLGHNEKASVKGLPEGTTYTVTEATATGFATGKTGDTGTITSNTLSKADFTNTKDEGGLLVSKRVNSASKLDEGKFFTFRITLFKADGTTVDTSINNQKYGDMTFKQGVATVALKHGQQAVATGIPQGTHYQVEEVDTTTQTMTDAGYSTADMPDESLFGKVGDYNTTMQNGDGGTITSGRIKAGEIAEAITSTHFINSRTNGRLTVAKTLISKAAADANQTFTFDVELDDTTINGTFGGMTFTAGKAVVTIKGNESISAEELPAGINYTITERSTEGFSLTGVTVDSNNQTAAGKATGTVTTSGSTATFTNKRDETDLKLHKKLNSILNKAFNRTFTFNVNLTGLTTEAANGTYDVTYEPERSSSTNNTVTFADGTATLELYGNEKATIKGLPIGVHYDVTETLSGDTSIFSQTDTQNTSGTLAAENPVAMIQNDDTTGDLLIYKTINNPKQGDDDLEFQVEVAISGQGALTEGNHDFVLIKEEDGVQTTSTATFVQASGSHKFTLTLKSGELWTIKDLPVTAAYSVSEILSDGTVNSYGMYPVNPYITGSIAIAPSTAAIGNARMPGNLEVSKELVSDVAADADQTFTFDVVFNGLDDADVNKAFDITYSPADASSPNKIQLTNGRGTITLKGGQKATIANLPSDVDYTVTEQTVDDFVLTGNTTNPRTGKIPRDGTKSEKFTNERIKGGFSLTKAVESTTATDHNKSFDFTVTLEGAPVTTDDNHSYGKITRADGTEEELAFSEGSAHFTLKDGGSIYAENLPMGTSYTITETTESGFSTSVTGVADSKVSTSNNRVIVSDTITQALNNNHQYNGPTYHNDREQGSLQVIKNVQSIFDDDLNKAFKFTVELTDKTINNADGTTYPVIAEGNKPIKFENGTATFTLKHNEVASINGLPAGIGYTVTEESEEGFTTTWQGDTNGTIVKDALASVTARNNRQPGELDVTKNVASHTAADYEWYYPFKVTFYTDAEMTNKATSVKGTYTMVDESGTVLQTAKNFTGGVAEFRVHDKHTAKIEGIPLGIYYKVEEETPEGFKVVKSGETGKVATLSTSTFTNTRSEGGLYVTKYVRSYVSAEESLPFNFKVTIYKNGEVDEAVDGVYGSTTGGKGSGAMTFEKGVATFTLSSGDIKFAEGLPVGDTYRIEELPSTDNSYNLDDYTVVLKPGEGELKKDTTSGAWYVVGDVTENDEQNATFTNGHKSGNLEVTKRLAAGTDTTDKFSFKVELSDKTISGTFGDMTFTNGVAEFTLGKDESKSTANKKYSEGENEYYTLPVGLSYTVTETHANGYTTTWTNTTKGKEYEYGYSQTIRQDTDASSGGINYSIEKETKTLKEDGTQIAEESNNDVSVAGAWDKQDVSTGWADKYAPEITAKNTDTVVFTNEREKGGFEVTKKVTSLLESDATKKFEFTVMLTDPSFEGVDGTITRKSGGNPESVTFTAGKAVFELADGDIMVAKDLPKGLGYTITETSASATGFIQEGWNVTGRVGYDSNNNELVSYKYLPANAEVDARATGGYKNTRTSGELQLYKRVQSDLQSDKDRAYEFTVTLNGGTGLENFQLYPVVKNGNELTVDQTKPLSFTNGVATLSLKDGERVVLGRKYADALDLSKFAEGTTVYTSEDVNIPSGISYKVEEETYDGMTVAWTGQTGTIATTPAMVDCTNSRVVGGLTVTKTVVSDASADQNAEFNFKVTLYTDAQHTMPASINGTYGSGDTAMAFTNGVAEFTLKNGEASTAVGLPIGLYYVAQELKADGTVVTTSGEVDQNFNLTNVSGDQAQITEAGATASFTNGRKKGDLVLSKELISDAAFDKDKEFVFTVRLTDSTIGNTESGKTYAVVNSGDKTITFYNGNATVRLKGGEQASAKGLPTGVGYTITEANAPGFNVTKDKDTGTISTTESDVLFVNERQTGKLKLSKELLNPETASDADKNQLFTFHVKLSDAGINGKFAKNADGSNNTSKPYGVNFTNGEVAVTLKHGQSITIDNLPTTITYTVTEDDAPGFVLYGKVGDKGTISTTQSDVVFTNMKPDKPTFDKKIKDVNDSTGVESGWQDSADYDIGDDVPYRLRATLSKDVTSYKKYHVTFTDQMEESLDFNEDSVQVLLNGVEIDKATGSGAENGKYRIIDSGTHNFAIQVDWLGEGDDPIATQGLNNGTVEVLFTAKLNENAKFGKEGNVNACKLSYSNNPNNDDTSDLPWDYVIAFTYKVDVNKIDQDGQPLAGATFELSKLNNKTGEYEAIPEGRVTVSQDGTVFSFTGLDDGNYRLKETEAPEGYELIDDIDFVVDATHGVEWPYTSTGDAPVFNVTSRRGILTDLTGDTTTGELTLTADNDLATLTGDVKNESLGSLKVVKKVTVNGKETTSTEADGIYTFAITGPRNYNNTIELEVKNGKAAEKQLDNLLSGTYTVKETAPTNGTYLTSAEGVELVVNPLETTEIPTATFTNNKPGTPDFDKKIADVNDSVETKPEDISQFDPTRWEDSADHDIGDAVPYKLTAKLANDVTTYKNYHITFTDKMENSLDFEAIKKVTLNGVETTNYTLTPNPASSDGKVHGFTLKLEWHGEGEGDEQQTIADANLNGAVVEVYFTAILNSSAKIGKQGNVNGCKLSYSNNPSSKDDSDEGQKPWDYVIAFTYQVDVNKVDEDKKPLTGAEFALAKVKAENTTETVQTYTVTDNTDPKFSFRGLDDGTYVLTETKAPDGYKKIDPITFVVAATHNKDWENTADMAKLSFLPDDVNPSRTGVLTTLTGNTTTGVLTLNIDQQSGDESHLAGDVTNTELGKLHITKNVLFDARDAATQEEKDAVNGVYTFLVTGPNDYSKTVEVEVTNGKSATVTVYKLEAGMYTVHEQVDKNPTGMVLLSGNDVEVQVEVGKNAEVKTAEFTNVKPGKPTFEKKIKDTNDSTGETSGWQDSADYDIGDDVPYKLTAVLANDVSDYRVYDLWFTDQMEESLSLEANNKWLDDVKIFYNDGSEESLANSFTYQNFEHSFSARMQWVKNGTGQRNITSKLNGARVELTFHAKLNDKARLGKEGNVNGAKLTYSNNPNNGDSHENTPWDYVIAFTYKVDVNKKDQTGNELKGAQFKLEKVLANNTEEVVQEYTNIGADPVFSFKGLDDGTYVLTETEAPTGYTKIDPITFVVNAGHVTSWDANSNGDVDSADFYTTAATPARLEVLESLTGNTTGGALELNADKDLATLTGDVIDDQIAHAEIEAEKAFEDWGKAQKFTFTLASVNGAPMPAGATDDGKLSKDATEGQPKVNFGDIAYTAEGQYRYTITETNDGVDGVTYDTTAHNVVVNVVRDKNNTLQTSVTYDDTDKPLIITNTFTPVKRTLKVTKAINDWGNADHFEFTLEAKNNAPMPDGATDGKITAQATKDPEQLEAVFGEITYDKAGTYEYTITETDDGVDGVTYDTTPYPAKVVVTKDSGTNALSAEVKYGETEANALTITNRSESPKASIQATKSFLTNLGADAWGKANKFTFTLKAGDNNVDGVDTPMPAAATDGELALDATKSKPTVDFGEIEFKKAGVYNYTITETDDHVPGVTYDTTPHNVVVTVTKGAGNKLSTDVKYDKADSLTINNTFTPVTATIEATKEFNDWGKAKSFTFNLAAVSAKDAESADITGGAPMPADFVATATEANKKATWGQITYEKPGVYTYTITERNDGVDGVSYDTTPHTVVVTVTQNEQTNALSAAVKYDEKDSLTITNTFTPVKAVIEAQKNFDAWGKAKRFEFTLTPEKPRTTPMPAADGQNDGTKAYATEANKTATWGEITYTKAGDYRYVITETNDGVKGVTYDTGNHVVLVSVEKDEETNELTATVRYDLTKDKLIITNTYTPDKPEFDKKTADVNDSHETKPEDISAFDPNRWEDSADHDIGDAVPYRLSATLADDASAYHKYHITFTDQMEKSLTFNKIERVTITPKDGVETDVEAGSQGDLGKYVFNKVDDQNFTLRIDWAGPNGGKGYIGDDENLKLDEAVVHVYFTATLNEGAKLGKQGNVNGAKLTYSNKPSSEDDSDEDDTPWDYVIAFTYKFDVNKVDEDKQPLEDAEFKLEKQIADKDGGQPTWEQVTLAKTGSLFSAKGLDDGIYRLTEVTAPDNHRKIDPIIIEVTAEHGAKWNYTSDEFDPNGQGRLEILSSLEGTQTNASETEGKLTLTTDKNLATLAGDLVNTKLGELVIQKSVTVNGKETTSKEADGTYTFKVTGPAEFEEADRVTKTATITITDGKSNTATVDHLYAGTYTVTELTDQSTNKAMKLLGAPAREVTVENGKTAKVNTVSFSNTKPGTPDFEKKIKDVNDSTGETSEWQDSADYDIGDAVPYKLTAKLPDDVTSYKKYHITFTDKMEDSLDYNEDAKVKVIGANGKEIKSGFTVDDSVQNAHDFAVRLDWQGATQGGEIQEIDNANLNGATVEVEFTATLNDGAKLGQEGNVNGAKLVYSNSPQVDDLDRQPEDETPWDYVIAFTYKVDVNKFDAQTGDPLEGARFKVEKLKLKNGEVTYNEDDEVTNDVLQTYYATVTDNNFSFRGLDDGTYLLTETEAPEGYATIDPVVFEVVAGHVELWNANSDGGEEPDFGAGESCDPIRTQVLKTLTGEVLDGALELNADEKLEGLTGDVFDSELGKLQIQKAIRGRTLTAAQMKAYTFTVTDQDGNVIQIDGKPAVKALADFPEKDRNGTLIWTIDNLKVGTYHVIEQRAQGDDPSYVWTHQMGQNGRVRVTANRVGRVKVTNIWHQISGDAELAVTKKVQSDENGFQYDGNEEFTFTLEKTDRDEDEAETEFVDELPAVGEEPGTEVTVTRKADGTYTTESFGKIKYASNKAHDYLYKITEVEPENPTPGMTYNTEPQYALVRVLGGDGFDYHVYYGDSVEDVTAKADAEAESDEAATVVNKYQVGQLKVVKTLTGVEDLSPDEYQNKEFTVTVQDENGRYLGLEDGKTVFKDEEITNTVSNATPLEFSGIPAGTYTVTETNTGDITEIEGRAFDPEASTLEATADVELGATAEAEIVNSFAPEDGSLIVKKVVESTRASDKETSFPFKVTLRAKINDDPVEYDTRTDITGTYGEMEFNEGVAEFELKDGESKKATDLPLDDEGKLYYRIEETDAKGLSAKLTEVKSSTEASSVITCTNTRADKGEALLKVKKSVDGEEYKGDEEFEFKLEKFGLSTASTDVLPENTIAKAKDGEEASFDAITYTEPGVYFYLISEIEPESPSDGMLYAGIVPILVVVRVDDNLNAQVRYIRFVDSDDDGNVVEDRTDQLGEIVKDILSGKSDESLEKKDMTVNNYYLPSGDAIYVKKVVDSTRSEDKTKEYTFEVTLSYSVLDVESLPSEVGKVATDINGKYGDMEFKNGVAIVKLKDGETKKASNLPAAPDGYYYYTGAKEIDSQGLESSMSHVKADNGANAYTCTNTYKPPTEESKKTTTTTSAGIAGRASLATTSDPTSFVGIIALVIVGVAGIVFGITRRRNK